MRAVIESKVNPFILGFKPFYGCDLTKGQGTGHDLKIQILATGGTNMAFTL